MTFRVGSGFDIHAFGPGDSVMLAGVRVPHTHGVVAHSDGDVLLHALVDALLGAAGLGDIGMHFPDTDPQWKGVGSLQFLRHACDLAAQAGYELVNVDSTIILERPKLKDYRMAIRENLAECLHLAVDCVSVKFKTAERVGPVGEGLSAEAQAIVLVRKISAV